MGEGVRSPLRVRVLLARLEEDDRPIVVAAVDESIWEHSDFDLWTETKNEWPPEYEWAEVWVELPFAPLEERFGGRCSSCQSDEDFYNCSFCHGTSCTQECEDDEDLT